MHRTDKITDEKQACEHKLEVLLELPEPGHIYLFIQCQVGPKCHGLNFLLLLKSQTIATKTCTGTTNNSIPIFGIKILRQKIIVIAS